MWIDFKRKCIEWNYDKKVIFWVRYSEISWKKKLLENLEIKLWYRKLGFEIL